MFSDGNTNGTYTPPAKRTNQNWWIPPGVSLAPEFDLTLDDGTVYHYNIRLQCPVVRISCSVGITPKALTGAGINHNVKGVLLNLLMLSGASRTSYDTNDSCRRH